MGNKRFSFHECVCYCGFDNLPEGLEAYYDQYIENTNSYLLDREFLNQVFERFHIPEEKQELLRNGLKAIEEDDILFHFTKFLVWDMCSARNRCDADNYTNLTPVCMDNYRELYSLLILLACVPPSIKLMEERGIPKEYYENIPYQPMERQLKKLVEKGDVTVSDFPWDLNFYTCSIFLLDRFFFIPYRFGDNFTMYRNRESKQVVALRHANEEFRRDGQLNGINQVYDNDGKFITIWDEDDIKITANRINPMGFVEKNTVTLSKNEWEVALKKGDILLALHVPSGPGYTPERLKSSCLMALDFYGKYFPEIDIKGFWSESWLYDSRLSLILDADKSNIVKVQRQFYLYPIEEGDGMFRYEAFGDWKADPLTATPTTSLQKAAIEYMKTGGRFNTLSMVVLREEADIIGEMPYITKDDIAHFKRVVDSHLPMHS